ncbi:hypothetical protein ACHAWF_002381 [Thalassiosira exigua]
MAMDLWGWVDDQRDKNRREFQRLLDRGRRVWTPAQVFNGCCVKWLVDGPDRRTYDEYDYLDEYSPRNGCNGRTCGRDHPFISLRFDSQRNGTVATMSHRLDPFVNCLNGLVEEGKAFPHSATVYNIDGYLRANWTALRSHGGFGSHLIKMEEGSLGASDAAQTAELEDERKPAAKRARVGKKSDDDDDNDTPLNDRQIFQNAMDIALKQRLEQDLQNDPMTLFCMRPVCKMFKNIATSIASKKAKALNLTITPLVDGREQYGESKLDGYDSETWEGDAWGPGGPESVTKYEKREKVDLAYRVSRRQQLAGGASQEEFGYYPVNSDAATFSWNSGRLSCEEDDYDEDEPDYGQWEYAKCAYAGQMLRVYWHPKVEDPLKAPLHQTYYGGSMPSLGFRVAEFEICCYRQPAAGAVITKSTRSGGITISYEVLESDTANTEEVVEDDESIGNDESDGDDAVERVERTIRYVKYSGKVRIRMIKADYGILVRLHARKVKSDLERRYSNIEKERPLKRSEKEYLKIVTAAAGISVGPSGVIRMTLF